MDRTGFEPVASSMPRRRSSELIYRPSLGIDYLIFNKHLKKRGLLLVQTKNAMGLIKTKFISKSIDTGKDRKLMGIKAVLDEDIDVTNQRFITKRTFYRLKDNKKVGSYTKSSRLYFPQELKFFLEQAGFEVLDHYTGELDEMTLKDTKLEKPNMLFVARKK